MAKDWPVDVDGIVSERHENLTVSVRRYVSEIEQIINRLEGGDFGELSSMPKLKRELMSTAKQLRDAEIELDQQRKKNGGADGGFAIDMDAARRDIGGRLDRLRAARDSGEVSVGPDRS